MLTALKRQGSGSSEFRPEHPANSAARHTHPPLVDMNASEERILSGRSSLTRWSVPARRRAGPIRRAARTPTDTDSGRGERDPPARGRGRSATCSLPALRSPSAEPQLWRRIVDAHDVVVRAAQAIFQAAEVDTCERDFIGQPFILRMASGLSCTGAVPSVSTAKTLMISISSKRRL